MDMPTLSQIADACKDSKFMVDNECNVIEVDYYDHTTDGVDYPKNEYPNGALVLRYQHFDIEIAEVIGMNRHGTIILSTRHGNKYHLEFLMTNPNPFQ